MYKAQAEGQAQGQPGPDPTANAGGEAAAGDDVQDVDFEEVK
jgi:molecular chaperone DnaK